MKHVPFIHTILLFLTFAILGVFVASVFGVWASAERPVYRDEILPPHSVRTDTVVVSDPKRQEKPDLYHITLSGISAAAVADSQFFSVVRVLRHGAAATIGVDSITLRPFPDANQATGTIRLIPWLGDSLQITTRNPMSTAVTGASLSVITERSR